MSFIHGKDQIELVEIGFFHRARSQVMDLETTLLRCTDASHIRWSAEVIARHAGRIDDEQMIYSGLSDTVAENTFCRRRTAYIPGADEKYPRFV